ncbi:venom metalloproteinase 3-like [Leptopilina heterotoma]|uniref:venom metalloproteinase 3-like n=1 Tax=Leptopilina heterotoma TaxID=63436 RepID=UPI001CA926A2|nr:venom metalloproteinase 3-like [Leptopilina heterotoma]XP_043472610.1 venom metalloproteinase 3-like [Leptopilina heterotoma]
MIYFILLCTISVQSVLSYQIHKYGEFDKLYDASQITHKDDYEVVGIKHLVHKRSSNDIIIQTEINGIDKKLYLKPTKGFFAGKRTKVWLAKVDPKQPDKFIYTPRSGIMEKVGTFYQDRKTSTTLLHKIDRQGRSTFTGTSGEYVIRPLPDYLLHVESTSTNNENNETLVNTVNHMIYKQDIQDNENPYEQRTFNKNISKREVYAKSESGDPKIIYPEIMIFVDDTLFSRFNKNVEKTVEYILSLWNGVDLRYRDFKNPEIYLNIARIILVEGPLPFEDNILAPDDRNKMFDEKVLNSFGNFLYNEDRIGFKRDYDVAILMTGKDLINMNYKTTTTGISFVGGACNKTASAYKIKAVGVIEDNGGFKGIKAGAHELAHLIGAPHDGDAASSFGGPGAETCSWDHGYLMSYERLDRKQFEFSSCSKQSITYFTSLARAECLRNNPAEKMGTEKLTRILPGKLVSLNDQCRKSGFYAALHKDASVCLDLWCLEKPVGFKGKMTYQSTQAAAEGSYCGDGMYCLDGECVEETDTT